jgi:hypothetical protein
LKITETAPDKYRFEGNTAGTNIYIEVVSQPESVPFLVKKVLGQARVAPRMSQLRKTASSIADVVMDF